MARPGGSEEGHVDGGQAGSSRSNVWGRCERRTWVVASRHRKRPDTRRHTVGGKGGKGGENGGTRAHRRESALTCDHVLCVGKESLKRGGEVSLGSLPGG